MSLQIFTAKAVVTSSNPTIDADKFDIVATISDAMGQYSALDVAVGDVLFADTRTSFSFPGVVSRYIVVSVASATFFSVTCRVQYVDAGGPVDPGDAAGQNSFISRKSSLKGFTWLPGPETQGISVDLIELAQNSEFWDRVDSITSGSGSGKALEATFTNSSGSSLPALKLVRQIAGTLASVDPSIEGHIFHLVGVTKAVIANTASGIVTLEGLIETVTTSFVFDDVLYLAKDGSLSTTVPDLGVASFVSGDWVVRVGQITKNASNPSNKDLKVKIEVVGQL